MRLIAAAVFALFALSACKKESASSPSAAASSDENGTAEASASAAEANDSEEQEEAQEAAADDQDEEQNEDEQKVEVTKELVAKYVEYQTTVLNAYEQEVPRVKEAMKSAEESGGMTGAANTLAAAQKFSEALEKIRADSQKKMGLTDREIEYVQEVINNTLVLRKAALEAKAEMDQAVAEERKKLANNKKAPPEQLAAAAKQIDDMAAALNSQINATSAREEYGDAAVDAVLAYEGPLYELQKKGMEAFTSVP